MKPNDLMLCFSPCTLLEHTQVSSLYSIMYIVRVVRGFVNLD